MIQFYLCHCVTYMGGDDSAPGSGVVFSANRNCSDDLIPDSILIFSIYPQVSEVPGFPSPNTGVTAGS